MSVNNSVKERRALTRDDLEAAIWVCLASIQRGAKPALEVARVLDTATSWAVACGADPVTAAQGMPGLPAQMGGKVPRIHWATASGALCSAGSALVTDVVADVTCGNCLRHLRVPEAPVIQPRKVREISQDVPVPAEGRDRKWGAEDARPCSRCGEVKAVDGFAADKANWDQRKRVCRVCDAQRRQEHLAKVRAAKMAGTAA